MWERAAGAEAQDGKNGMAEGAARKKRHGKGCRPEKAWQRACLEKGGL